MDKPFASGLLLLAVGAVQVSAQVPEARKDHPLVDAVRAAIARALTPAPLPSESSTMDLAIATCLWLDNQEEVSLARFAADHAKSDEVQEFAAMMVKDHEATLQALQKAVPEVGEFEPLQTQEYRERNPAPAVGDLQTQMTTLQQRVTEQSLSITQQELAEQDGAAFDRCYIGQQIGAHVAMLAKLRGSQDFASGQLRQFIDEATITVKNHYAEAKKIANSLESVDLSAN